MLPLRSNNSSCIGRKAVYEGAVVLVLSFFMLDTLQVYTSSLDGYIGVWDYTDGGLLKVNGWIEGLIDKNHILLISHSDN